MASDILKKTLLHYINLEYYANELDEEFQTLLEELTERCNKAISSQNTINTKATYKSLINIINEEIDEYQKELEERLDVMAELVMNGELEFLDETYNTPIREGKGSSLLIKGALALGGVSLSKVLFAPLDGRDTLDQFVDRTAKNILRAYDTALRSGYLFGKKAEEITSQVSSQMKQVSRGVQNGIRTIVPSVAKNTDKIVFLNNDIEVVWCATLDGRTCINCASLSGLHFKSIADAPTYPQHCLCRCVLIPASTVKEPIPDFDEFIEMLDEEEQKEVLGVNRFNLMNEYGVKPSKFLNDGRVISWDDIKSTYSQELDNIKTAKFVKQKYPDEAFVSKKITDNGTLYISKERIKAGIKDKAVYASDKLMAKTLIQETNRDFYMLTEGKVMGVSSPDGFYLDDTIEMKHIRGDLNKLGKNAIRALSQSNNIYLYCDKSFSIEGCKRKLQGSLNAKRNEVIRKGLKFNEPKKDWKIYIYTDKKLHELTWGDIL